MFALPCSQAHIAAQTTRKKMADAILLLLPAHAQESNPDLSGNNRYLFDYKPLAPLEPAEPEPAARYIF